MRYREVVEESDTVYIRCQPLVKIVAKQPQIQAGCSKMRRSFGHQFGSIVSVGTWADQLDPQLLTGHYCGSWRPRSSELWVKPASV